MAISNLIAEITSADFVSLAMTAPRFTSNRALEEIKEQAEKCLQELSKQINMDRKVLERTMREIAEDPYTLFLYDVWCFEDETQTKD